MSKQGAAILVVDDEKEIVRALQRGLTAYGYRVLTASSGQEAFEELHKHHPDVLLLDLMLPDMSGLEVCRRIRAESNLPIIVLSVKDAEYDKIEALDLGADDYVPKPFGMDEVLARIRVALRHAAQLSSGTTPHFHAGPLSIDFSLRRVTVNGQQVSLTPTEYDLLKAFVSHRGKVLTRQMLLKEVWGDASHARTHSLHVYVAQLRQKIEPDPEHPHLIFTVPGVGYRFNDEAEA
ncbi:MAG TPA: response regulator transcription factor [Ktedonobacteraceae bacterium]|nr:response regulator transcription factor [Ktedonobacteraceae bacterium]